MYLDYKPRGWILLPLPLFPGAMSCWRAWGILRAGQKWAGAGWADLSGLQESSVLSWNGNAGGCMWGFLLWVAHSRGEYAAFRVEEMVHPRGKRPFEKGCQPLIFKHQCSSWTANLFLLAFTVSLLCQISLISPLLQTGCVTSGKLLTSFTCVFSTVKWG